MTQSVSVLRGTASVPRYLLFAQRGRFLRVSATGHSLTPVTPAGARPSAHAALPLLAPGPTQSIAKARGRSQLRVLQLKERRLTGRQLAPAHAAPGVTGSWPGRLQA